MKKFKIIIISLISIFAFNLNVNAASSNLTISTNSAYVGDSFTVTANVNSAATWNIHVSADGPISGCTIEEVNNTKEEADTNKTFNTTCTATGEGEVTITLTGDVASVNDENASSISDSKKVNITKKPTTPSNDNNTNTNKTDDTNNNKKQEEKQEKSTNNKLKEISIEGYELEKKDDNNYELTLYSDVDKIVIKATAEDEKAKIKGDGKKDIKDGENKFEVVITSESGEENKINIVVTKKESFELEDLENLLKDEKKDDIEIKIDSDTIITKEQMSKIKESKKTVTLNYYDDKEKLSYSWILDGSKIKEISNFQTSVLFKSKNEKDIAKLANNVKGLNISIKQEEQLPEGTKLKIYVKDKLKNNSSVYIYYYDKDKNKLDLLEKNIKVKNNYLELNIEKGTDYFITNDNIEESAITTGEKEKKSSIIPIIIIVVVILLIVIAAVLIYIFKIKPNKKKRNKHNKINNNTELNNEDIDIIKRTDTNNMNENNNSYQNENVEESNGIYQDINLNNNINNQNNTNNSNTNTNYNNFVNDVDPFDPN